MSVLGLISVSIEMVLSFTYKDPGKAVGRAVVTVGVDDLFLFSTSVQVECEREFAGSDSDPSFHELMGPYKERRGAKVRPARLLRSLSSRIRHGRPCRARGRELRRARCVRLAAARPQPDAGRVQAVRLPGLGHWTRRCTITVSFKVEFADTARHDADVVSAPRSTTRPGITCSARRPSSGPGRSRTSASSRSTPIRSASSRPTCANCTSTSGAASRRSHPSAPGSAVSHHGGPGDRCACEGGAGAAAARAVDMRSRTRSRARCRTPAPEGCLTWLLRALLALLRLLQPLCKLMPAPVRGFFAVLARRLSGSSPIRAAAGPDQAEGPVDRVVHPSPYVTKPPLGPPNLPHLAQLEQKMAADKVIAPTPSAEAMADALAARDTTFDFARAKRFFERPESAHARQARRRPRSRGSTSTRRSVPLPTIPS